MKIYKLDIDAAQPTNQVVQMQQNTAGVLSVNVTKNGNYIRNLSCQMFDGETEISACSAGDNGFKLDIGDTPKHYMVKATATPYECSASYVAKRGSGSASPKALAQIQLETGIYRQDEFNNVAFQLGDANTGSTKHLYVHNDDVGNVNFKYVLLKPWITDRPVGFYDDQNNIIPEDELIIVTAPTRVMTTGYTGRTGFAISSFTYPAVGYYVNYQADTLVKPSPNANAFSEIDILPTEAGFQTLSTDSFTLSGVTYVPTTLSVDGVAYSVLAAPVQTPEPEPDPEQTEG